MTQINRLTLSAEQTMQVSATVTAACCLSRQRVDDLVFKRFSLFRDRISTETGFYQ